MDIVDIMDAMDIKDVVIRHGQYIPRTVGYRFDSLPCDLIIRKYIESF